MSKYGLANSWDGKKITTTYRIDESKIFNKNKPSNMNDLNSKPNPQATERIRKVLLLGMFIGIVWVIFSPNKESNKKDETKKENISVSSENPVLNILAPAPVPNFPKKEDVVIEAPKTKKISTIPVIKKEVILQVKKEQESKIEEIKEKTNENKNVEDLYKQINNMKGLQ